MSVPARAHPARRLDAVAAARPCRASRADARGAPAASTPPQPTSRARRWHHPVFWLFAGVVVSVLVMGLVALNALLVQTTYRMQTVQQRVADLSDQQVQLKDRGRVAVLAGTVAKWARLHELTMPAPGDTVILPRPGRRRCLRSGRGRGSESRLVGRTGWSALFVGRMVLFVRHRRAPRLPAGPRPRAVRSSSERDQRTRTIALPADRGQILDRDADAARHHAGRAGHLREPAAT